MKLLNNRNRVWYDHIDGFVAKFQVIGTYNMVRNHITQKTSATEKLKINFENATLLDGWDRNKEPANYGILLEKDNLFYLAVMTADSNRLFDYEETAEESAKKTEEKRKRREEILATKAEAAYRKMNYKLLPGANKMLPKVFFAKSNCRLFNPPDEIVKIKDEKLYTKASVEIHGKKNLHDYITFCQQSLCRHPEWSKTFNFTPNSFRDPAQYNSIDEFYRDVELQGYSISFDNVKESYINEKIASGELYLFQIYNKDFSSAKKSGGRDNLHTIYWKGVFAPENLENTVLKLNGQAEIFFRQASVKHSPEKMQTGHHAEKLKGKFESFQKMGKQSGILFYTTASYTSTTDPVTGFLKNVNAKYQNLEKSLDFWRSFDSIVYNPAKNRFEFTYTLGKIASKNMVREPDEKEKQLKKRTWTVCSCVTRSRYVKAEQQSEAQKQNTLSEQIGNRGRHEAFFVTDEIKKLLLDNNINFAKNPNIQAGLTAKNAKSDVAFHKSMAYYFNAIMTMRVTDSDKTSGSNENDFILSPVEPFFDSRKAAPELPENGDANGAYNIARKGICILRKINATDDVSKVNPGVSKQEWQNFVQ